MLFIFIFEGDVDVGCLNFIDAQTWESKELKQTVINLAKNQDVQLMAFYRSLGQFPSSFVNVVSKYAKFAGKPN